MLAGIRLPSKNLPRDLPHEGNPRAPSHQHRRLQVFRLHSRIGHRPAAQAAGPFHQRPDQPLKLLPLHHPDKTPVAPPERQPDFHFVCQRQAMLGVDGPLQHPAPFQSIQSRPSALIHLFRQPMGQHPVRIIPAQPRIPMSRQHLENPLIQLQNTDIKGSSSQIINCHPRPLAQLIQSKGQRCRGRFI